MEQYARLGCEARARWEGRSSSGARARARAGLGARTARSRGDIRKQTEPSRCQVSAQHCLRRALGGRLGTRGIEIAHSVFFPSGEGLSQGGCGVSTHSSEGGESIWPTLDSTGLDRMSDLLGRRVRWMSRCASPRTVS